MTRLSLLSAARELPQRDALILGEHRYRFADLAPYVARAAAHLRQTRTGDGPVCFVAEPNFDTVIAIYAALELGMCIAPLHHRLSPAELDARTDRLSPAVVLPRDFRVPGSFPDGPSEHAVTDDDAAAAVIFTSGSTGVAKGTVLSRGAFLASAQASATNLGWHEDDRWLLSLSLAHVGGLCVLVRCLAARRCMVVDTAPSFDPKHTVQLMDKHRATLWSAVPTMVDQLMCHDPAWAPPPALRAVLLGGAAAPAPLLARCRDRGVPALPTYGMTETCSQVCTRPLDDTTAPPTSAGPPLAHAEVRIGDGGVIEVRTTSLANRYIRPHDALPVAGDDGWYRTRDRGRIDGAGHLHVLGRTDDTIITGGECVDPIEVESVLGSFPGVAGACVYGVPDDEWGDRVAASVICAGTIDTAALRAHLRASLASFKHPRLIHWTDTLPTSHAGKRDRHAARKAALGHLEPL